MRSWLMRTIAASAAALSCSTSEPGRAAPRPLLSRKGAIHSKPHSSGRTTRFSSRVVSRVSHSYIQRAYHSLIIYMINFISAGRVGKGVRRVGAQKCFFPRSFASFSENSRSEEHTSELQSPHYLLSFPPRRSSDLYDHFYRRGTGGKGCAASWGSEVLFPAQFC